MKPKKSRSRWLKFIGHKFYCLPEVTDHQAYLEALDELPVPLDFWWLVWMYEQGCKFRHGLVCTGELQ